MSLSEQNFLLPKERTVHKIRVCEVYEILYIPNFWISSMNFSGNIFISVHWHRRHFDIVVISTYTLGKIGNEKLKFHGFFDNIFPSVLLWCFLIYEHNIQELSAFLICHIHIFHKDIFKKIKKVRIQKNFQKLCKLLAENKDVWTVTVGTLYHEHIMKSETWWDQLCL